MVSVTTSLSALLNLDGGRTVSAATAFFFKHLHFVIMIVLIGRITTATLQCSGIIVNVSRCVMLIGVAMGSLCSSAVM
jgi:hypothetical protein